MKLRAPGALCSLSIVRGNMIRRPFHIAAMVGILLAASACGSPEIPPAMRPLSKDAIMLLGKKGMRTEAPIFVRVFKEESELEIWKQRDDGHFYHFKTYPICTWSGDLGPKLQQGDKQAPEGFYSIHKSQMNPNSKFYLAFNIGYPNNYDRANRRTGDALMVHGKCSSAGCYAMTDALIEEIYALAREQFSAGHEYFQVHAYPFRMTDENMARHKGHRWYGFWKTLKEGYDYFEVSRKPPPVVVCERRYHVNVRPVRNVSGKINPESSCPRFEKPVVEAFVPPTDAKTKVAHTPAVVAPGRKMRTLASIPSSVHAGGAPQSYATGFGLTQTPPAFPQKMLGFTSN